jgi:hypothetical protein
MTVKENRHNAKTTGLARKLAEVQVSQSRVSTKLDGAQKESLVVQLSAEATRHTEQGDQTRPRQIEAGLASFMMSVSLDEKAPAKRVKRRVKWTPNARAGQVKEGLAVMGRLSISDEVDEQADRSSQFLAVSINSNGSNTNLSFAMGRSRSNSGDGSRIEGGGVLRNLMRNGLVADGLKALLDSDKQGQFQTGTRNLTVRTNSTGRQRILFVTRGGQLNQNTSILGATQVLDGKPVIKKPTDMSNIFRDFSGNGSSKTPTHP